MLVHEMYKIRENLVKFLIIYLTNCKNAEYNLQYFTTYWYMLCKLISDFSGLSGSGKTHQSKLLLRHIFEVAGGGTETDSFKHLSSAMTVLQSLGSAATVNNPHSSRMVGIPNKINTFL